MSSRDGFAHADIDVGFYYDPKVRRLRRDLGDDGRWLIACAVYMSTVLESWQENRRLTADEASVVVPEPELLAALQKVGLLDGDGRVPDHAWVSWQSRAVARRAAGKTGADARWQKSRRSPNNPDADALPSESGSITPAMPVRQAGRQAVSQGVAPARDEIPHDDNQLQEENDYDSVVAHLGSLVRPGITAPFGVMVDVLGELVDGYGKDRVIEAIDADTDSVTTDEIIRATGTRLRNGRLTKAEPDPIIEYDGADCMVCHLPIEVGARTAMRRIGDVVGEVHDPDCFRAVIAA